jgi:acyl-CoA reductase-like NAD-dependent aldehyde dehydrogenase
MATVEQPPATAGEESSIRVSNPATGELVATVPRVAAADVADLVARARAAQPAWESLGFDGRARVLRRAQRWVVESSDRIARTIVSETGKAYDDALMAEVGYAAAAFGFWAKQAPRFLGDEKVRTTSPFLLGRKLVVRYRPLGVIGVIGPWNYPLTNSFGDCIPALAAGNAAVLKPSQATPLTSLLMAECLRECGLPEDLYLVATGDGAAGEALIDAVDMIMFTGSTPTGRRVMERAARTLTPVSLELGGKDPMIVLADADVERAANTAVYASMQNGGQTCVSIERVYVEEPIYEDFVQRVARKVGALRQGTPAGPGSVDVGAMTFAPQLDVVRRHVDEARAAGARILAGGRAIEDGGRFYAPTVIADADHTMSCMTEETFGPTVAIMRVRDADEAVTLANDSPYGLSASVFSKDVGRAEQVARRIEAGAACINDAQINYFALELPMGGWKESGLGSRHGAAGIRKYCRQQSLLITRLAPKKDLNMFPYRARTTGLIAKALRLLYGRGDRG